MSTDKSLKRLTAVNYAVQLGASAAVSANGIYKRLKAYTPASIVPTLTKIEDAVATRSAPYVVKLQDYADFAIHFADDEVDYIITVLEKRLADVKAAGKNANATNVTAVSQSYIKSLLDAASAAVGKVHSSSASSVQAAHTTFKTAVAKAQECTDPDVAVEMASDAWASFAAIPAVAKVLTATEPLSTRAIKYFYAFHDTLVTNPYYKAALDLTASTLAYAASTTPYKLSARYMYPVVQPVAEPAITKVTQSKIVSNTVQYWKPVVVPIM